MSRVKNFSVLVTIITGLIAFSPSLADDNDEREGGIVGTGIVGIINSLGSIHVNGQIIEFPPDFPIISPLGPRDASSLKPGETVVVEAVRQADKWIANSIRHLTPLLGPVSLSVNQSIMILGSEVIITPDTIFQNIAKSDIADGDHWLAIDGIWNSDKLVASYIRKVEPRAEAQVTASYFGLNAEKEIRIGGVSIDNFKTQHINLGDVVTIVGVPHNEGLSAKTITRGLFKNKLKRKLVEGFLSQPDDTGFYTVYGSGAIAYISQSPALMPNGRGLHCIIYDEDDQIQRIIELPKTIDDRTIALSTFSKNRKDLCF